jgi:hypothetical protein
MFAPLRLHWTDNGGSGVENSVTPTENVTVVLVDTDKETGCTTITGKAKTSLAPDIVKKNNTPTQSRRTTIAKPERHKFNPGFMKLSTYLTQNHPEQSNHST